MSWSLGMNFDSFLVFGIHEMCEKLMKSHIICYVPSKLHGLLLCICFYCDCQKNWKLSRCWALSKWDKDDFCKCKADYRSLVNIFPFSILQPHNHYVFPCSNDLFFSLEHVFLTIHHFPRSPEWGLLMSPLNMTNLVLLFTR